MYDSTYRRATRWFNCLALAALLACPALLPSSASAQEASDANYAMPNIVRQISSQNERLELTTNTSRILTLEKRIPRFQVNNPELLGVTALSANQIQISAKEPGVTQVNLWDEDKQIHTVDVVIYGDLQELEHAIKAHFPNSSIKVRRHSQSLVMTGFVNNPDHVSRIMRLAEDYAPKIIDNLSVGGVQQVLLKVQIFEVSRTKLRQLGVDWIALGNSGGYAATSISGLISAVTHNTGSIQTFATTGGQTFEFGIVNGNDSFFGFLDALQQHNIAKILSEPQIVSVSGRPAQFLEGGEIPILVPQSLGTTTIEYKPFGTQVDFLPIVLGNGRIRLEVRPQVSDIAPDIGVQLQNINIPGFRVRRADTAVEMQAGQTFALGGLIQRRIEGVHRGIPVLADIPGIGMAFRSVQEQVNEIELLFLVTPEYVDAMEPHEVPQCMPGMATMSPNCKQLYVDGHLEVPNYCSPCGEAASAYCGPCCEPGGNCGCNAGEPCGSVLGGQDLPSAGQIYDGQLAPPAYAPVPAGGPQGMALPAPGEGVMSFEEGYDNAPTQAAPADSGPIHGELRLPPRPTGEPMPSPTSGQGAVGPNLTPHSARHMAPLPGRAPIGQNNVRPAPRFVRNPQRSTPPSVAPVPSGNGLIGPVGYDVE